MSELHLYDFGIFIELMPDKEEKQMLENNIQMAINQKLIDLDDAIDLREIRNLKMANQMLKIKRKKKLERDQKMQQDNIKKQSEANQQAQQAAAQSEIQKNQAKAQTDIEFETAKNDMKLAFMKQEAEMKKQLMDHEFEINRKLKELEGGPTKSDAYKEDRKDERVKLQDGLKKATQTPKKFESAGNDTMGAGSGISIGGLTSN